jgi:D-alanyl-lipoteichoic acid acyltransferase DltB (MBOAT superfamily)
VAGPIERAQNLLPVFQSKRYISKEQISAGIQLVLIGFVKKIAIADAVAPEVNRIFADPQAFSSLELLLGVYLFALQIYGDFSGYSDIARGVSKFMGIELMVNFRQPYLSKNIQEFWRRWHISLSTWLRDYLYIPLGGNRKGAIKTYRNLFITMLLGGLWHGASWTFVVWGGGHGIYLAINRYFSKSTSPAEPTPERTVSKLMKIILTFHLVSFTWILFRAPNFAVAYEYILSLFNPFNFGTVHESLVVVTIFYVFLALALDLPLYKFNRELLLTNKSPWVYRSVVYTSIILLLSFLGENNAQPFIYFQF